MKNIILIWCALATLTTTAQNPYADMGNTYGTVILTDKEIEIGIYTLYTQDTSFTTHSIEFHMKSGLAYSFSKDGTLLLVDSVGKEMRARWLASDPYKQTFSPYSGMGNNPIMNVDPNGGFFQELGNWVRGRGWISNEGYNFMKNNPGSTYNGWTGNRFTGHASIGYMEDGAVAVKGFRAVQDIPHFGFYNLWGKSIITTNIFTGSSFTPGNFVISGTEDYHSLDLRNRYNQDHYRHEFGHIEQYQILGLIDYYKKIVLPSVKSFHSNPEMHDFYYTEKSANLFGGRKYGEFYYPKLSPILDYEGSVQMLHKY